MIAAVWGRFAPYVIAAGVVAVAVVLFISRVFGAGKTAAKAEAAMDAPDPRRQRGPRPRQPADQQGGRGQ